MLLQVMFNNYLYPSPSKRFALWLENSATFVKGNRVMSDEEGLENLANAISLLTDKLDGVGIEIYHLQSSIDSLKNSIDKILERDRDE